MIEYSFLGQKNTKNIAHKIPIGTPTMMAPAVTYKLPMIIGKIPNISFNGFQSIPKIKSATPIFAIAGRPFINK